MAESVSFADFLRFLMGEGAKVAVGVVLSWLVELWPEYQSLGARWKRLVFAALCFGVPLCAALLMALFGYAAPSWENLFWPAIVAGFLAFSGGTIAHTRKL